MATESDNIVALPDRMFASGEEPSGERVHYYLSSVVAIRKILRALDKDEIQLIRESRFRKLFEIVEKSPAFSGRFAKFIMSQQLKVKKKHEAWFRFAGHPIRFSLREFAIVTGLPCGKYPKAKRKNKIGETPYWPSLMGSVDVLCVSSVLKMLRVKTVTDRAIRINYACLSILASVLLPTNTKTKILKDHAESIKDLNEFFEYPWGRRAFEMLMSSIKSKDKVSLSNNTITLSGFVLALQLVMVAAIPELIKFVHEEGDSSSQSEQDDDKDKDTSTRLTLTPAHARDINNACLVHVKCIIDEDPSRPIDEPSLTWSDEEEDEKVDNLVALISQNQPFCNEMFKGGATKVDVERMRQEAKAKARKNQKRPRKNAPSSSSTSTGTSHLAAVDWQRSDDVFSEVMELYANLHPTSTMTMNTTPTGPPLLDLNVSPNHQDETRGGEISQGGGLNHCNSLGAKRRKSADS